MPRFVHRGDRAKWPEFPLCFLVNLIGVGYLVDGMDGRLCAQAKLGFYIVVGKLLQFNAAENVLLAQACSLMKSQASLNFRIVCKSSFACSLFGWSFTCAISFIKVLIIAQSSRI